MVANAEILPMIKFEDFVPELEDEGGLFRKMAFEAFQTVLDRANKWIDDNNIDVVNIETVVLPNIHSKFEEGSTDVQLKASSGAGTDWHQFIRIWYRSR